MCPSLPISPGSSGLVSVSRMSFGIDALSGSPVDMFLTAIAQLVISSEKYGCVCQILPEKISKRGVKDCYRFAGS